MFFYVLFVKQWHSLGLLASICSEPTRPANSALEHRMSKENDLLVSRVVARRCASPTKSRGTAFEGCPLKSSSPHLPVNILLRRAVELMHCPDCCCNSHQTGGDKQERAVSFVIHSRAMLWIILSRSHDVVR